MPRDGQEVAADVFDVEPYVGGRLRRVYEDERSVLFRFSCQLLYGVYGPEDVRRVDDRDELRPLGQEPVEFVHVEPAPGVHADDVERYAEPVTEHLPRDEVRVVLHYRDKHLVPGPEITEAPAVCDEVYGFGRVTREHHRPPVGRADEAGDFPVGGLVHERGLVAERVDAAVDVRIVGLVVIDEAVQNLAGFLSGGGVV